MPLRSSALAFLSGALRESARNGGFAARTLAFAAVVASVGSAWQAPPVSSARFIENLGQWPADVRYAADIGGVVARAECGGLGFHAIGSDGTGAYVRLVFENGAVMPEPIGIEPLQGVHHYYFGNDPSQWHTNAHAFARVEYRGIYPGVDLVLRSENGSAKYDLVFAPGADVSQVRARWLGAEQTTGGALGVLLGVGQTPIHELPVIAWQTLPNGGKTSVESAWVVDGSGGLQLRAEIADPKLPLVVDPEVVWGTYLGSAASAGSGDLAYRVVVDDAGDVYMLGQTGEFGFPTTPGAVLIQPGATSRWITVAKFGGADGHGVYVALLGGSANQVPQDISIDNLGRALVAGTTLRFGFPYPDIDFPSTAGSYDSSFDSERAAFAFRLSPDGSSLDYSTFLEGGLAGYTTGVACHAYDDGTALIGGYYIGTDQFPSTLPTIGTLQPGAEAQGSYVAKLDPTGSTLVWSRLLGDGAGIYAMRLGPAGEINLVGAVRSPNYPATPGAFQHVKPHPTNTVLFATQLSADAQNLNWSTFLGSSDSIENSFLAQLGVDDFGTLTFDFTTNTPHFPTTQGTIQPVPRASPGGFHGGGVARLSCDGSQLVYSTYLSVGTGGFGAASVDASGVLTLLGGVGNFFPATAGSYDEVWGPGSEYQLARVDPYGRRFLHLRHFGGPFPKLLNGTAVHANRRVTLTGSVQVGGIPTTPGAYQPNYAGGSSDAFLMSLDLQVAGVTPLADGTPACHGLIVTEAWRNPVSGASDFGLYCSGAPSNAHGALIIGRPAATPSLFGGALLHIDRSAGIRVLRVRSDAYGYLETELPVPALTPGTQFTVQYLFQNTPTCSGTSAFSSSNALGLVVQ